MVNFGQSSADGAKLYKLFQDGQLVYTDSTHKAWMDEYYNQLMSAPDLVVFRTRYASYMQTYHPYEMSLSYGTTPTSI